MEIKIKEIAKRNRGWSVYELAKQLGNPPQTVYGWAGGRTQPSYKNMDLLCKKLKCTMSDLFAVDAKKEERINKMNCSYCPFELYNVSSEQGPCKMPDYLILNKQTDEVLERSGFWDFESAEKWREETLKEKQCSGCEYKDEQ